MSTRDSSQTNELPDIPEYPDSPLSAWKHYGIMRVLEGKFHEELEKQEYDGHLVGLMVTYTVGGDPYSMGFGYGVETKAALLAQDDDPLSDEFVSEMYDFARSLIAQHINQYVSNFELELGASVNPKLSTLAVKCMIATNANCGKESCVGKCRKFISRNNGPWVCTHTKGLCTCS